MKKLVKALLPLMIPAVLGLLLLTGVPGYSFSGLLCFGLTGLIAVFQLLRLLERRFPKTALWIQRILSCLLIVGVLTAAVTWTLILTEASGMENDVNCQYVVVLGAGVNGNVPSLSLSERLNAARDYLILHPDTICVVSGGQGSGESITEAACMYDWLTRQGVAPQRIWQETEATSTRENIRFSLDLIEERTGQRPVSVGVVSSEYHLFRAGLIAQSEGVAALGIPAKTSWVTLRLNYYLREIVAVWAYLILGG